MSTDGRTAAPSAQAIQPARHALYREGELWVIESGSDGRTVRYRNLAGFGLLHQLLSVPNEEIHALTLVGAHAVHEGLPGADRSSIEAYRRRLVELRSEIDEFESHHDDERAAKAQLEYSFLVDEITRNVGIGGRARSAGADAERARVRVTRALRSVLERMEPEVPLLARSLQQRIKTGVYSSYLASTDEWVLQARAVGRAVAGEEDGTALSSNANANIDIPPVNPDASSDPSSVDRLGAFDVGSLTRLPSAFVISEVVPLSGPEKRLAAMERCIAGVTETTDGTSRNEVLLLTGPAGCGKSRTIREVARRAAINGVLVLAGSNDAFVRSPFQPFERALRDLVDRAQGDTTVLGSERANLSSLFPQFAESLERDGIRIPTTATLSTTLPLDARPVLDSGDSRPADIRFADALLRCLEELSIAGPVLLIIEDLHHATDDTITMLSLVLSRNVGLRCVLTYNPLLVDAGHPAHRLLADFITRNTPVEAVEVPPMDASDIESVLEVLAPHPRTIRQLVAPWVARRTGGNALYAIETVRALADQPLDAIERMLSHGDLVETVSTDGRLDDPRLREVVLGRLSSHVPADSLRLLRAASLLGVEFEADVLAALCSTDLGGVLEGLARVADRGVISTVRRVPLTFGFAHAIVRQVLYDSVPELERMLMHHRAAAILEERLDERDPDRASYLAYHYGLCSGSANHERAIQFAISAGDVAWDRHAYGDAAGWFRHAEALVDQSPGKEIAVDRVALALRRGSAERRSGIREGRETLLRAARMALSEGRDREVAEAAIEANRGLSSQTMQVDAAWIAVLESALDVELDDRSRAELLAIVASELMWAPDGERRFALSDSGLSLARELHDPVTLARVLFRRDHTIATLQTVERRVEEAKEHLDAASQANDDLLVLQSMKTCASSLLAAGDVGGSIAFGEEMMERADALGLDVWRFMAIIGQAGILVHLGRLDEAMKTAGEMMSLGTRAGHSQDALSFFGDIAVNVARWRGTVHTLIAPLRGLLKDVDGHRSIGYAAGPRLFDGGAIDDARSCLDDAFNVGLDAIPRTFMEFMAFSNLSYLSSRFKDARLVPALEERLVAAPRFFPCTTSTGPCGAHSLGLLATLREDFDASDSWFEQALQTHLHAEAPLHYAETQLELAETYLTRGGASRLAHAQAIADEVRATASTFGAQFLVQWAGGVSERRARQ